MPGWVKTLFLQYLPWLLMMQRPGMSNQSKVLNINLSMTGKKITRKTILMEKKLKELDKGENMSKSLLVNVLDIEESYNTPFHISNTVPDIADVYKRR